MTTLGERKRLSLSLQRSQRPLKGLSGARGRFQDSPAVINFQVPYLHTGQTTRTPSSSFHAAPPGICPCCLLRGAPREQGCTRRRPCASSGSAGPGFDYHIGSYHRVTSPLGNRGAGDVWPQLHPSGPKHIGVNKTCRLWPAVTSSCTSVGSAGPGFDYLLGSCLHATSLPFDRGGGDVWPQLHPASASASLI